MTWVIFIACTIITIIAACLLTCECEIIQGIAMSIIAAYIFYIIMEFIPALREERKKQSAMAITYRKLQLMLYCLDSLFVEPYCSVVGHEPKLSTDAFYEKEHLKTFLIGFDLTQNSDCVDASGHMLPYSIYFFNVWERCQKYANEALNTLYMQYDPELAYEVQYLLSDSSICHYFNLYKLSLSTDYGNILSLIQENSKFCEQHLHNIKVLHKKIFNLYDRLKRSKKFPNIYMPSFYSNTKEKLK